MGLPNPAHFIDTEFLQFRIGELSKMANVSARQLRYWEQKKFIKSNERVNNKGPRVYSFVTYVQVRLMKRFLDTGYTLQAAYEKSMDTLNEAKFVHQFIKKSFQGVKEINGQKAIDLGYFDAAKTKRLFGFQNEEGAYYQVIDDFNENLD
ncbi:MerR family transcriptional regulator [Paucilactobacillus sp. N302-9]